MKALVQRLRNRTHVAASFSTAGEGWQDRVALYWAGIARMRPFAGRSFYARVGRFVGREVQPRLWRAGGACVHLDLITLTDLMVFEEIFLENIYPLDAVPFSPELILDCGACAGLFTLLAHARFPSARFHLFEPEPANLSRLHRNLVVNRITAEVHAAAVGTRAGRARFCGEGFGGHLAAAGDGIEVEVMDLPGLLRTLPASSLLVKIDIEGAEQELLPELAMVLPPRTALFLETHQAEPVWQKYLQPLLRAGFARREIRQRAGDDAGTAYIEHLLLRNP